MVILDLRPTATQDIMRSAAWWEERQTGLKARFVDAVERRIALLAEHPGLGPPYNRRLRRLVVREFYQGIFYRIRGNLVEVVAVLDLRRDPREIARALGRRT